MKTLREIKGFRVVDLYSGERGPVTVPKGSKVGRVSVDVRDAIFGEPVAWMDVEIDGKVETVGAINLPVFKLGWRREYFGE